MDLPESLFTLGSLDRLLATIKAKSEAFEIRLDAAPQTQACPRDTQHQASLNREASMASGSVSYTCPACEHEAFLARSLKRMESAGIPADVRHATLENFDVRRPSVKTGEGLTSPQTFLEKARLFATGECRNIVFAGAPGIGKGHLAAALCIRAIFAGESCGWITCARLFAIYHRAYKDGTTDDILERYSRVSVLVFDEICLRELPADGEEILFEILDRRHKAGRKTILLGNKAAKETRAWLGDRISDRLRSGKVAFCYGEWESMRGTTSDGAAEF